MDPSGGLKTTDVPLPQSPQARRIPEELRKRLEKKGSGRSAEEIAEDRQRRLEAAEERRKEKIEEVKKRAVESRPTTLLAELLGADAGCASSPPAGGSSDARVGGPSLTPPTTPPVSASVINGSMSAVPDCLSDDALFSSSSASYEYWKATHALSVPVWCPELAAQSFRSKSLPLSRIDIDALLSAGTSTPSDLRRLEQRVDKACTSLRTKAEAAAAEKGRCFVRLSSRCGKDQVLQSVSDEAKQVLWKNMEEARASAGEGEDAVANMEAVAVLTTVQRMLGFSSGAEAVKHLMGSSRVATDLKKTLQPVNEELEDEMNLVVRRFDPSIKPSSEWRCFVYRGTLTAISQYYHHCYFPSLDAKGDDALRDDVASFVRRLIPHLPSTSCVVDVSFGGNGPRLVELNPFHHSTDACLFDWSTPMDLAVLVGEERPGEEPAFRRRSEPQSAKAVNKHITRAYRVALDAFWHELAVGVVVPSPTKAAKTTSGSDEA